MIVRLYRPSDYAEWHRLRTALWPDQTVADMAAWLARPDAATFVVEDPPGRIRGFAEVGARPFADGCDTQPVAYLEGWYVDTEVRGRGLGAALLGGVEGWARERGYRELASDTELANLGSQRAHERLGFTEVERAVRYCKALKGTGDEARTTMSEISPEAGGSSTWEGDIRAREEEARAAFLAADLRALDQLWADDYAVNSPLQQVVRKPQVLELLRSGRIRHTSFDQEIEYIRRHGDVVVVMGKDTVTDPPDGVISQRRYTNIWQLDRGVWRSIARHAHVVARKAGGWLRAPAIAWACLAAPIGLAAQEPSVPRRLSATVTGCDSSHATAADSVYEADAVDRQVRAPYVRVSALPYRLGEVLAGRTMLRFVVEPSGWIDRCSIALVEESSAEWTDAVVGELRRARYEPARKNGKRVPQVVYQVFTYHSDGRTDVPQ